MRSVLGLFSNFLLKQYFRSRSVEHLALRNDSNFSKISHKNHAAYDFVFIQDLKA